MNRHLFSRVLLVGMVAWAGFGCALELYRSWWLVTADPWQESQPSTWRVGSGPVERLELFARRSAARLPAGAVVAVVSEPGPETERRIRSLWYAFFLPAQDVRPGQVRDGGRADFWIAHGTTLDGFQLDDHDLELLDETPTGALYRSR